MITANQWYNIAQTAQVGTKSGIRIDFGTKYALFKVSVDYGNAVIAAVESNITAEETRLSVRIRYNNSAWFVDVRFSVSQETTLSAATYDNTGWEAVSPNTSVAGNTICIINDLTSLIRPSGGGESLFELMNVGTAEVPRFAVVPKKYNGVEVGIISNTFISMAGFEEPDDDTPVASSSLGDLLDVQITDPKSKDVLTYDEDLRKWVNGPGGLDETALGNYLTTNKYITQDALTGALNGYVTNEIYNTAITALNLRLTELETAFKEWFYYDDVNKAIRTKLSLIVDGTLSMGELGSGGGTEVASGKLADLLDVQITDPASGQILLYNEEKGLWVNGSAGLNEEQLEAYLKVKDYATNSALSSLQTSVNTLRTDFDNLNTLLNGNVGGIIDTWNEVVSFLDGYSQSDDLASILSGMNSDIANRVLIEDFEKLEGSVTDISNRVKTFEDVIGIDDNGDVYIKGTRNFYTAGGTISMFSLGEGDSGEVASVSIKFEGSDDVYSAVGGIITLPAYPSGGGVADSVAWSNVTGKPTTLAGYGITDALSVNGGFISSLGWRNQLNILRAEAGDSVIGFFNQNTDNYLGAIGFDNDSNLIVNVKNVGNANVLHSGNYSSYALPLSGGTINGTLNIYDTVYRSTIKIVSQTNQPNDLWFGANGVEHWSLTSRDSAEGYLFALYANYTGGGVDSYVYTANLQTGVVDFKYQPTVNGNTVIHTGNIGNQSVNYANSAGYSNRVTAYYDSWDSGWGLSNLSVFHDWNSSQSLSNYFYGLKLAAPDVNYKMVIASGLWINGLSWRKMEEGIWTTDWRTLIDEYNISDYNAGSATKLQTGRYLWGNYFNGESDVNGKPFFKTSSADTSINVDIASIIVGPVTSNRSGYSSGVGFNGLLGYGGYDNHLHGWIGLNGYYSGESAETYALVFAVNDNTTYGSVLTERMRITPNGNVLIGTTTDNGFKLQANGGMWVDGVIQTTSAIPMYFYGTNVTCGLYPNSWISNDGVNNRLWLYNDNNLALYGEHIELRNDTSLTGQLNISFAINALTPVEQAIVINSAAYASTYDAWPGIGFHIPGSTYATIKFGSDSCFHFMNYELGGWVDVKVGNLVATGTTAMGTLSSSSDARLKDNIELLTEDESLAVLRQLRPSKWNWKSNGALSYGFIAQEVEGIASCMVDRMNDEELGQKLYLQYNQLHAFEVGAIQHIDSEVEQLKRDLNTANLRIKKLENELKQYRLCQ